MINFLHNFLKSNGIKINRFYGLFTTSEKGAFSFTNVLSKSEGNLIIDEKGNRINVWLGFRNDQFELNKYYEFSIYFKDEKSLPSIDLQKKIPIKLDGNPFETIVNDRYERLDRPESNKIIANLLREIGKGMYSSKERMIFELLQNADDSPAGEELKFHIDSFNGNLLIMHNGLPFNKDDVSAITSAAQSTKKNDAKKTGYKGIGFKSVFTDSQKVTIKSGGFLFYFDRNHPPFKDFESFYFDREEYRLYPELKIKNIRKWSNDKKSFNGFLDIPWQLLPIWKDEVPIELEDSRLLKFNNNVGIALEVGNELIDKYLEAIESIAENPVFILFLRHISLFKSFKNALTIKKTGVNPVTITKTKGTEKTFNRNYLKKVWDEIPVSDEEFRKEEISIFRQKEVNDYGDESYYFSRDEEGKIKIENIPPKISATEVTSITFAAPILEGKLCCETDYFNGTDFNAFFTYLPLSEKRIRLPFLVNADFVLSSNREGIQGDNEWNEFLFSKIGGFYIKWLQEIANLGLDQGTIHPEYLSLLLKEILPDQKEVQPLINTFNARYLEGLDEISFIIDYEKNLRKASEIIVDKTGISDILNCEFFYEIYSDEKYLSAKGLNVSFLDYEYLNVTKFEFADLIPLLKDSHNLIILKKYFKGIDEQQRILYQNWVEENFEIFEVIILDIFLLPFENEIFSLNEIVENEGFYLQLGSGIDREILELIGFKVIQLNEEDYPATIETIRSKENYINLGKGKLTFDKLTQYTKFDALDPIQKHSLLSYIIQLKGVGPDKWAGELKLFKAAGKLKPLDELISSNVRDLPSWMGEFVIDEKEEDVLDTTYTNRLLRQEDIFEFILCNEKLLTRITDIVKIEQIPSFYSFVSELFDLQPLDTKIKYKDLPWLYSSSEYFFKSSNEFYVPTALNKAKKVKYANYCELITKKTELITLDFDGNQFRKKLHLGGLECDLRNQLDLELPYNLEELLLLLEFLELNEENDFFKQFYVNVEEFGFKLLESEGTNNYYSNDKKFNEYIASNAATLVLLPTELYSLNLTKIGLLENEYLVEYLLDNYTTDIDFVNYLYPYKNKTELNSKYFENLATFNIESEIEYRKKAAELKIIELALTLEDEAIEDFRNIITVDKESLTEKSVSDDIYFPAQKHELSIKLSELLPEIYGKETFQLNLILKKFEACGSVTELKRIFKVEKINFKKVAKLLSERELDYLDFNESLFWIYYFRETGIKHNFDKFKSFKDLFDEDKVEYQKQCSMFLSLCIVNNLESPFEYFTLPDFRPEEKIWNEEFSIEEERVPEWVKDWVGADDEKLEYLFGVGFNGEESHVVEFRKAIEEKDKSKQNSFRSGLSKEMLKNTLVWIKGKKSIEIGSDTLFPIYEELESHVSVEEILLPICSEDSLVLEDYQSEIQYHYKSTNWGSYKVEIQNAIWENGGEILDDTLSDGFRGDLNIINEGYNEELDLDDIIRQSIPFEEDFYKTWENKERVKILVYPNSTFPLIISYNEIQIAESYIDKSYILDNDEIYVLKKYIDSIPVIIKDELSDSDYKELISRKNAKRKNKNEDNDTGPEQDLKKSDYQFSNREEKALMELFDNNPDPKFYKNWNLATLIKAIVELPEKGYNVKNAKKNLVESHEYAQLEPVYLEGDEETEFTIMGRSAANGLLYLTVQAWQRLKSSHVNLFVNLGGEKSELFTTQQEVLDYAMKSSEFQIMRISMDPTAENINDLLDGDFDKKKIWLVFRMKNSEKTDYLFNTWKPNDDHGDADELQLRPSNEDDL